MNQDNSRRTYKEAGFNRFFRRSLGSNSLASTLKNAGHGGGGSQLNFDNVQVSGSLGDSLKIGRITLDGKKGRQSIFDELNNEVLRLGELEDE